MSDYSGSGDNPDRDTLEDLDGSFEHTHRGNKILA